MSNCLVCSSECPPQIKKSRWGSERKYCSSRCVKTAYRQRHPEKDYEAKRKYAENNKEKRVEQTERYRKANMAYYNAYMASRRAAKLQATPTWLTEEQRKTIQEIYRLAAEAGLEVDHIVPLKGRNVRGLHVPWNLQMLTRQENASKFNKWDDEDVCGIFKE